jgi:hypothetical protein
LCPRHAGALVLPRGWTLHDQRTDIPEPLAPLAPVEVMPLRRVRTRTAGPRPAVRRRPAQTTELPLDAAPVEPLVSKAPPQLAATEEPEELADVLDASTPLLQRAFRNTRPD